MVPGSPRIRSSFVLREIPKTDFRKAATSEDRSTNACAGHWRLILCWAGVALDALAGEFCRVRDMRGCVVSGVVEASVTPDA